MLGKEHNGHHGEGKGSCCMGILTKKSMRELKIAMLKKKEKILEAKLEFVRRAKELVMESSVEDK